MLPILIDIALGVVIGLTLGLLGGGGSILTVPALVYIVGQSPQAAVTASLIIVGMNSMMGTFFHRAQGTLNWKVALVFGGAGMFTAYLAAGLSKLFPGAVLLLLFALLMLVVGTFMLLRQSPTDEVRAMRSWPIVVASGAGVGLLTGLLGVGGGFLIVPALVMLVGLPIQQAVGTSLIVITMNSLAGFLGHLNSLAIDYTTIAIFVAAGLIGTLLGAQLAKRVHPQHLRRMFAGFVILLAIFLLYDNVGKIV